MYEREPKPNNEVPIPDKINKAWLDEFNSQYEEKGFNATVVVEDWLEQPRDYIGSAYYDLEDEMGEDGWKQRISGELFNARFTNVPHYSDKGRAPVMALRNASIQYPDGNSRMLAGGRLVLVRLDRLITNPKIVPGE